MEQIRTVLEKSLFEYKPVKLIFSNARKKSLPYKKVTLRPVIIQCQMMYQAEYQYEKKVIQDNLTAAEVIDTCADLVERDFKQVNIFTEEADIQILASKPAKPRFIEKPGSMKQENLEHNQVKNYIIPDEQPCDFLIRLGVMDKNGKVFRSTDTWKSWTMFMKIFQSILTAHSVSSTSDAVKLTLRLQFTIISKYCTTGTLKSLVWT